MSNIPASYLPPQFTPTVEFKDGSFIYAKAGFNSTSDELWIWLIEYMSVANAVEIFSDNPSKTDHIRVNHSQSESEEFDNYTHLISIQENAVGDLAIRLKRS